uniref:Uncharacterized protein n=1 Tax=Molossus molossus TaxID=27622 RepID=A0A7J8GLX6_MOLMO|nr:hypothetical protein HJG59_011446 [Molossus molossus]
MLRTSEESRSTQKAADSHHLPSPPPTGHTVGAGGRELHRGGRLPSNHGPPLPHPGHRSADCPPPAGSLEPGCKRTALLGAEEAGPPSAALASGSRHLPRALTWPGFDHFSLTKRPYCCCFHGREKVNPLLRAAEHWTSLEEKV